MKRELLAGIALFAGATLALAQAPVTIKLGPQNKSGESGTAKLTPEGDSTKVEISLKGGPKGASQPAHIHEGSCSKLDPNPKYEPKPVQVAIRCVPPVSTDDPCRLSRPENGRGFTLTERYFL